MHTSSIVPLWWMVIRKQCFLSLTQCTSKILLAIRVGQTRYGRYSVTEGRSALKRALHGASMPARTCLMHGTRSRTDGAGWTVVSMNIGTAMRKFRRRRNVISCQPHEIDLKQEGNTFREFAVYDKIQIKELLIYSINYASINNIHCAGYLLS